MSASQVYADKFAVALRTLENGEQLDAWHDVERNAKDLANALRARDGPESLTELGRTRLPQHLAALLTRALQGSPTPDDAHAPAVHDLLRVAANLCIDHDDNRGYLLEAGLPQAVVTLLEGYAEIGADEASQQPLAIPNLGLQVVKTSIGVLLNASVGYEPVKHRLISLEAGTTLLKLSTKLYPPGSWATAELEVPAAGSWDAEAKSESWSLRSTLSGWAWRTISELKDDGQRQLFGPDALPLLVSTLKAFIPPYSPPVKPALFSGDTDLRTDVIEADLECLEESCTLLESLALDVADVRLSLARGLHFPAEHAGVPCLTIMLDFIEHATYPPWWKSVFGDSELRQREKTFNICKAAMIKAIVEVAAEEKNDDVLWDDSETNKPGGVFVYRMIEWLKSYASAVTTEGIVDQTSEGGIPANRDDLAICSALALGNLSRREAHATVLLTSPYELAPILASSPLLSISTDIKIKHGVIGLLKHLAQSSIRSSANRDALVKAGIVQKLTNSGVWDERSDVMAQVVQAAAIGVVKHLCAANLDVSLLMIQSSSEAPTTGLAQILSLVKRSDSVAIKSEGTRVVVNLIKSIWATDAVSSNDSDKQTARKGAMSALITPECATALASLIGRSVKYPLLVNEGIVALSLLSTHPDGAPIVARALLSPLLVEATQQSATPTSSQAASPTVSSPITGDRPPKTIRALNMLMKIIKSKSSMTSVPFPVEVRANACVLLSQAGAKASGEDATKVRAVAKPVFEELSKEGADKKSKETILSNSAKKALETWI